MEMVYSFDANQLLPVSCLLSNRAIIVLQSALRQYSSRGGCVFVMSILMEAAAANTASTAILLATKPSQITAFALVQMPDIGN